MTKGKQSKTQGYPYTKVSLYKYPYTKVSS